MIKVFHNRLGTVDLHVAKVDAAVNDYDERLYLDKHKETGDWVVMIRMERPSEPYPVMGFQYTLPEVNEVIRRLRECDSQREDIRARIMKYNKEKEKAADHVIKEKVGAGAELAEFVVRKNSVHDYRSLRKVTPKKKAPANRE